MIDVSDPTDPQVIGSVPSWSRGRIAIADGYAYITAAAEYGGYVEVVDVTDSRNPWIIGGAMTPRATEGVAVSQGSTVITDYFGFVRTVPTQCSPADIAGSTPLTALNLRAFRIRPHALRHS